MALIRWIPLSMALLAPTALAAAAPNEQQCTQAIASAQKILNDTPAKTPRDKEDLQRLKERQEKLITDNRRNGISECRTWSQVMGMAFNQ